jgi:hypothetical protein
MQTQKIRKIGGSLYFQLPFTFKHKYDLREGDPYDCFPNQDGSIIKFVKAEEPTAPNGAAEQKATVDAG